MPTPFDQELDCSGMSCPMPILKTKKAVDGLQSGQVLKMTSTDPGSLPDVKAWTAKTGHALLEHEEANSAFIFYIQKK